MSTIMEHRVVLQRTGRVSDVLLKNDPEYFYALVKVLTDYLHLTTPDSQTLTLQKPEIPTPATAETMKQTLDHVVSQIIGFISQASAAEDPVTDEPPVTYTPEELSLYFGVALERINQWIDDGCFLNVKRRHKNRSIRISENVLFKTRLGDLIPVWEIVASYHKQREEMGASEMTDEEERQQLLQSIQELEQKYGGTFEETLGILKQWNHEQERDAGIWEFYLCRVCELQGDDYE